MGTVYENCSKPRKKTTERRHLFSDYSSVTKIEFERRIQNSVNLRLCQSNLRWSVL